MFSKADPASNLKRIRVNLRLRSGDSESAYVLVPAHRNLREALNDETPFLELETDTGGQAFVLKLEVARVDPSEASEPRAPSPGNAWSRFDAKDARLVLGVPADASADQIRSAWKDLARAYHPDRLAALGLPDEMLRHADAILARINAAYQRLKPEL
jgi:DnaJ-domain-containing protein 1